MTDLSFGSFTLSISSQTGAITRLRDQTGREWCDEDHALGLFQYDVYNKGDYDRYVVRMNMRYHFVHFYLLLLLNMMMMMNGL